MENVESSPPQGDNLPSRDFLLLSLLGITGRAPARAWDYLPLRDRMQLLLVSKTIQKHLKKGVEYAHCRDGALYRVPFPGFPGLLENSENDAGLFPHQLASLHAMTKAENCDTHYGALRGGILADAPGLGKTITVLALIASTAGKRPQSPPEFWNESAIADNWRVSIQSVYFQEDILAALKPFRQLVNLYPQLASDVKPPLSPQRFPTIRSFEAYVRRMAKDYATQAEMEQFRLNMLDLRARLDKSLRKITKSVSGRRMAWERYLVPTSSTLFIVPDALLEHWFQQIHQHLNLSLFADEKEGFVETDYHSDSDDSDEEKENTPNGLPRGVVYIDGVGDIADARMPLVNVSTRAMDLPKPLDLTKYMIVITTFSRCKSEFRKEVDSGRMGGSTGGRGRGRNGRRQANTQYDDTEDFLSGYSRENPPSPLLQIRWLRICVDEGHEIGSAQNDGSVSLTRFVNHLAAERRWIISGTPTTGDEDEESFTSQALDQLQQLMLFLRHPVFGTFPDSEETSPYLESMSENEIKNRQHRQQKEKAKEKWSLEVKEPFIQKKLEGRTELLKVLRSVMVMHRKEDIHLHKPIFRQAEVNITIPEKIQMQLQENPETSAEELKKYLFTDDFQTLVDEAQGKYIVEALQKARKELNARGGPLKVKDRTALKMITADEVEMDDARVLATDRRPIKAVIYSSKKFDLRDVTEALYKTLSRENIAEAYDDPRYDCGSELSRFRNDRSECRRCPICGHQNDIIGSTIRRGVEPTCQNILVEVVALHDSNIRFLIEEERIIRAVPQLEGGNVSLDRLEGASLHQYGMSRKKWRVGDVLEVDIRDPHPLLKQRETLEAWEIYGVEKCEELAYDDEYVGKDWFFGPLPALTDPSDDSASNIFEQWELTAHTMKVRIAKWQKCSRFHSRRWYEGPRLANAPVQTIQEDVFVLSLDAGLAHGLDLSFATHIFLLEPVQDAALLEQITSRAHRLGATGPVFVETIHPFYEMDKQTTEIVEKSERLESAPKKQKSSASGTVGAASWRNKESLKRAVCQHCFRAFDSIAIAEKHEQNACIRNPANEGIVDPWSLSSLYRAIRPPPSPAASARDAQQRQDS